MEKYNIGIIGGGPAGYMSAIYYSNSGKNVILFEESELGGTCLNRGCIPTKAFLHISDLYSQLKNGEKYGISADNINLDFQKANEYKNGIIEKLRKGIELSLKNSGVTVIKSHAEILSDNKIKTDDNEYYCDEIIAATGSKPKNIPGLEYDHKFIISSDDILELVKLPKSILIVGSGAIGIEWARILSSFGVEVNIVELADRLCPIADWEISKRIERQFKTKKINIYLSTSIKEIKNNKVVLSNGIEIMTDKVLVAVGREPNLNELSTNIKIIGDASSEIMLAHYAVSQAKEIALNIPFNKKVIPSVIYGTPEIAWVGETSSSKENDSEYDKSMTLISSLGKAHCDDCTDGFIKILSKNGQIVGASIVSPEGSALIQQLAIAIDNKISINELKKVCFAHPTYSEGIMDTIMRL